MNTLKRESETALQVKKSEKFSAWYLLNLIKPIIADELVANFRFDREGLRISFANGQKFRLEIREI